MHILIVRNNSNSQAVDASLLLATYLATQSFQYTLVDSSELSGRCDCDDLNDALSQGVDLAVVLGGDGTILRTARQIGAARIPILGINFGRLGFLANSSEEGVVSVVAAALAGDVVAERRTNLRIDVVCEGERDPWDDSVLDGWDEEDSEMLASTPSGFPHGPDARTFFALNELAVTRGVHGRVIDFEVSISEASIAEMRGDGVVVATATGSTAYALSAGGPLVSPEFSGLVVVPIAPHTLHSRAILTSPSDVVEVNLPRTANTLEATLLVDGELLEFERPVKRIYVRRGDVPTTLLKHGSESFYKHASEVFF